jgi:hypothetical protein
MAKVMSRSMGELEGDVRHSSALPGRWDRKQCPEQSLLAGEYTQPIEVFGTPCNYSRMIS